MKERKTFKGSLGFVLAAASSAVGLGNIWRFPYLAAKDGGGIFLFVYLILAVTFGFALLTTEVSIGRKTKQSPLTCYGYINKNWKWLGIISCLVPAIIMPYYCAIGGWVIKYMITFISGNGLAAAEDGYFTGFITAPWSPVVLMIIFLCLCTFVILAGVNRGIEASARIIMPILIVLVLIISVYSLTLSSTDVDGVTRTGWEGLKIYIAPDFKSMTLGKLLVVTVDAMGQLFFSLSVAMGIMIAYGSYVHDDANLVKSINQIEIFDTGIAFLAGVMIIPAVFTFMGTDGLASAGPGLMFVSLPKVFASMGPIGTVIGIMFFVLVLFAAVTSAVSIMEAVVSSIMDQFHVSRKAAAVIEFVIALVVGVIVCFGYNRLYFEYTLPNGSVAQVLDILDYISNNILMPFGAIATCILIGWVVGPKVITDEVTKNGEHFGREKLFIVMIKYIAPVLLLVLLLKSIGIITI